MSDGTSIRTSAMTGTCRFSETSATLSGRILSNAAAKITRVEERNSVPAHPRNHAPNRSTMIAETSEFLKKKPTINGGYVQTLAGPGSVVYP